ncbi:hypothetical protein BXY66_3874 [Shimia isoporae]|uniref:Uncharacterized protein n=1 Tax=Shimia isoporae TaxID=647720 RepID=A0A4R1N914_9RHOB|nr:hypothetical protein BXY66_3874 [Shimia isoporae]
MAKFGAWLVSSNLDETLTGKVHPADQQVAVLVPKDDTLHTHDEHSRTRPKAHK